MQFSARESYLATEVRTATPQKLQLMLIESAIRSAQRARQKWQTQDDAQASDALIHAQEIVGEILAALNPEVSAELVGKVAAVYMFILRSLAEANQRHDERKLNDAIKVLEVERQTWRMACEKLGGERESDAGTALDLQAHAAAPPPAPHSPDLLPSATTIGDLPAAGLSLEG